MRSIPAGMRSIPAGTRPIPAGTRPIPADDVKPVGTAVPGGTARGEVAFVLLVIEAAAGAVAALGMVVLMGGPLPAVVPLAGSAAQVALAAFVLRGRCWAWGVTLAMHIVFVFAFAVNGVLGLLPQVDMTVTVTGLLTRLALPVALICLSVLELARPRTTAVAG